MEEGNFPTRRWEDLKIDILVKILQAFDFFETIFVVSQVCRLWRLACSNQDLWKTLDLSVLQSNFIRTQIELYVYVHIQSDERLTCVLNICLNLSRGNILTLIFHYNLYVNGNQLA